MDYQRPKAPVAKRVDQMPQWSLGDTIGYLSCDLTATLTLRLERGPFEKNDVVDDSVVGGVVVLI